MTNDGNQQPATSNQQPATSNQQPATDSCTCLREKNQQKKLKNSGGKMKYHLACLSAILALMYGSVVAEEDFDDSATLVEESDEDDEEEAIEKPNKDDNDDAAAEEISPEERKNRLKAILKREKSGTNYDELKVLQKNGFVVTAKSFADLAKKFNNAVLKVDLFESDNMNSALREAFNFAMDMEAIEDTTKRSHIFGEYKLPEYIGKNSELSEALKSFIDELDNPSDTMEEKDIQMNNLEKLKNIYSLLEKDKNIGKSNGFSKFINGMISVYKVLIARRLADEIIAKHRASTEDNFTNKRKASSAGAGTVISGGVASTGASVSYHSDEGSSDSSFYSIDVGGGTRLSVGVGLPGVGVEVGAGADVTKSAIFYSLEQLLDSGKISTGIFSPKKLKETLKSRQKMQSREKELLSIFGRDVEGYLKMIGKIPVSVYLEWPKLTKSSPSAEATNISKQLDASISILETAGLNVVTSADVKTWKRPSGYMTLISDDCYPSNGLSAKAIVEFLGKQYDISQDLIKGEDRNTKKSKKKADKDDTKSEGKIDPSTLPIVLPIILGDIRNYNSALRNLAEKKSAEEENTKHSIEKRWSPKHKFTSEGRLGVLKSMIATAAVFRDSALTDRNIELFKQLHTEMSRLAQLLEFSKNKSNRSATFMKEATSHNKAIQASASISIPRFGNAEFSFTRSFSDDSPFQDENGNCMGIDITLPIAPTGIVGTNVMHRSLNTYHQLISKNHSAFDYGDTFRLARDGFDLMIDDIELPVSSSLSGNAILSVSMCRVDASDDTSVRPLPDQEVLTKAENQWVTWYVKGTAYLSSEIELSKFLKAVDLNYSSSIGKEKIIIGTNTLGYLTSRFNAFSIGLQDSKDAMSPWYTFKTKQESRLIELLKNIANLKSNVRYELQSMYNTIMDNIGEKNEKTLDKCTNLFKDLLAACDELRSENSEETTSLKDDLKKFESQNDEDLEDNEEENEDIEETKESEDSEDNEEDEETKESEDSEDTASSKAVKSKAFEALDDNQKKAFEKASKLMDEIFRMNFDYNFMNDYRKAYQIKK